MKKLFLFFVLIFCWATVFSAMLDLNTASLEELRSLPISEKQAQDIHNYRFYIDYFKSIYDLRAIESIDQKTMNKLKPLVSVSHYQSDDEAAIRRDEIYYLIERLGSNEGLQEGISDVWEDYLMTPRNINKMPFSDIFNLPNTSAIDVAAILKRRANGDTLSNYRDLRFSPGISYYGARNIRYYVYYEEPPIQNRVFVDYQFKYNDMPYADELKEMYQESMIRFDSATPTQKNQSYWGFFNLENNRSSVMNKLRIRYMNEWKAGILTNSPKGNENFFLDDNQTLGDDAKYYVGYEKEINWMGRNFLKIYAGNFRATFGEGLVMENTDTFSPRQTGYGFNKRIIGVIGDLSRTQQYSLRGAAIDWKRNNMNAVLFLSNDKKDAIIYDSNNNGILDKDDYALSYIIRTNNFSNDELEDAETYFNDYVGNLNEVTIAPRKDAVEENLIGGHLEYSPFIGTHIGVTGYEATYNRDFVVPDSLEELQDILIYDDETASEKWKITDAEITNLYSTKTDKYDRNYRRVLGFDWRTTLNNTSIQGEYAEMEKNGELFKIGDDPKAIILSSYTQFENLYFLTMFRHYDLEFDNPYQRSFSESQRYDDTVFEKLTYGLRNTLLTDMYINSVQPSAERGFYFETRYQFHRMFTITKAYLDVWERLSDARQGIRFQGTLEFKPIHQMRFRVRHKVQIKRDDEIQDRGKSQANETELFLRTYLSNFDQIQIGIIYAKVLQPPYLSILSDPAFASAPDMAQAITNSDGEMIYVDYRHNFNDNLKIQGSFAFWKAYGASFWDFEDVELDFDQSDRGFKYWFTFHSRISNNLFLSFKYKYKQFMTRALEFRLYNEIPPDGEWYFDRVENKIHTIRLQLDWKF
ncbi:MAG: helix-hairpin-helix domain-containing protein [Candidatus Cloacimonetes bacterium]|nr:helix-hairpin-helix domain-containing protein [Candidatus Cloacimonadota bacterium]MCF7812913.1 helix-hairpin-helix domain-containing protein [Candidatus Cloacimonadota bacterium]MCF7867125.1 helix-hairpin-helix domain-containing protein [Candidatus Cloacimonadota bacterium]MCF7882555.1 helix-hairpin-helix domain-containing protein [Candidatus Cloacimonadota bacterium]